MGHLVARYVCSLALLTGLVCYTALIHSIHEFPHSLCSSPCRTVEICEYVFTLRTRLTETIEVLVISGNTLNVFCFPLLRIPVFLIRLIERLSR